MIFCVDPDITLRALEMLYPFNSEKDVERFYDITQKIQQDRNWRAFIDKTNKTAVEVKTQ